MEHIYAEKHSAIYLTNTDSLKEHFLFVCLEYFVYDKLFMFTHVSKVALSV